MNLGVLRLASDLISRASFATRSGITFGGKRDLFEALGFQRVLRPEDFRDRYARNGIAARVVEAAPLATWRGGAELIEDDDPDVVTPFEETWSEIEKRLKVWSAFSRADVLAGLGRYAVVLIGAPGELETPLPPTLRPEQLLYLTPRGEQDAIVDKFIDDPQDVRYGLPEFYQLKLGSVLGRTARTVTRRTHWSRVLHIADGVLDDRVYGTPRLERVWNDFDNLEKVTGGGSEAFWLRVNQGMYFNVDKEIDLEPEEVTKAQEQIDEYVHNLRRTMMLRGAKMETLGSDVANFDKQVDSILTLISGATGIPKRILMGSERGELASTQDRENWETKITDRRADFAEPFVVRPFVDLLIERGVLPEPTEYEVQWPEIESLTEVERGQVATSWARLSKLAGGPVVLPKEIRDRVLRLDPLSDEQVAEYEGKEQERKDEEAAKLDAMREQRGLPPFGKGKPDEDEPDEDE